MSSCLISIKDSNNTIVTIDIMTLLMTEGDLKKEKNILMKDSQTKHISTITLSVTNYIQNGLYTGSEA